MLRFNDSDQLEFNKQERRKELEKNPALLEDTFFLIKNIHLLDKNLSDLSPSFRNNELFLFHYFSNCEADKSDYQFISKNLLNNKVFISGVLHKNPDIYLLLDEQQKNSDYFTLLEKFHSEKILKYCTIEELNNFDYCYKKINTGTENYEYAPDHIKTNEKILKLVFGSVTKSYSEDVEVLKLIKFLPKEEKNNTDFIENVLMNINILLFPYVTSVHRENFELCKKVIGEEPEYFKYLGSKLKLNSEFVKEVLVSANNYSSTRRPKYYYYDFKDLTNKQKIITMLPIEHFSESFCEQHKEDLCKCFPSLPSSHRKELHIIRAALSGFKENEEVNSGFEALVGIKDLRHAIKDYTRKEKRGTHVYAFVNNYTLQQKLAKDLNHETRNEKKMKI